MNEAVFLLGMLVSQADSEALLDGPPADWIVDNGPYGADITFDGKVWINMNRVGLEDDYAVLANDLFRIRKNATLSPTVWIRGYHQRNKRIRYRETKALMHMDCQTRQYDFRTIVRYSNDGRVVEQLGSTAPAYIVPGSQADSWSKMLCPRLESGKL